MNQRAFTMIEILLVVIMISVLAAMVVPNLTGRTDQAKLVAARGARRWGTHGSTGR